VLDNANKIIRAGFAKSCYALIEKMKYQDKGEIIRYALDVLSNLASHPDDMNKQNLETMLS